MINSNLSVSKIVATPTENSWTQAYNAGSLFAVLALTKISEENEDDLNLIGKEVLNTLEEEYYTLEEKNLETVKKAFSITCEKLPGTISSSFIVSAIVNNVLYILSKGKNRVILKRGEKVGAILDAKQGETDTESKDIISLSGFLEKNDLILLSTEDFATTLTSHEILSALECQTPADVTETLSPKIHGHKSGGAAAIVILYKKNNELLNPEDQLNEVNEINDGENQVAKEQTPPLFAKEVDLNEEKQNEKTQASSLIVKVKKLIKFPIINPFSKFRINSGQNRSIKLGHSKKVLLTISIILISILITSAIFASKKQEEAKTKNIFEQTYKKAKQRFDEGNALLTLNKNLAREDLAAAQKILEENKSKFKPASEEEKQTLSLLSEIEKLLNETAQVNSVSAQEVDIEKSPLLSNETKNSDSFAFSQDEKNIYFAKNTEVYSSEKSSGNKKSIIKDSALTDILATSPYNGNIYALDKKSKILKFAAADDGYGKSDYLKEEPTIDWAKTKAMSIDGSIWILLEDGTIYKFTKGTKDNFKVSGLDTPFIKPTKIFTDKETDNVYILDNGNSRIVILNKDGAYQSQYSADIIGNAKDFEVLEKDKKVYLLSGNKIYEIDLK